MAKKCPFGLKCEDCVFGHLTPGAGYACLVKETLHEIRDALRILSCREEEIKVK